MTALGQDFDAVKKNFAMMESRLKNMEAHFKNQIDFVDTTRCIPPDVYANLHELRRLYNRVPPVTNTVPH